MQAGARHLGILAQVALLLIASGTALPLHARDASPGAPAPANGLPSEVDEALRAAERVILYSLEPEGRATASIDALHGFRILGTTELDRRGIAAAIGAFKDAVAGGDGSQSMCFEPRHAIRVTSKGTFYDLLLCYECQTLVVYQADKVVAGMSARGSPTVLDSILRAANVPLSPSGQAHAAARIQSEAAFERWLKAVPRSVKPLWQSAGPDLSSRATMQAALAREFPDAQARIRALYAWYGSEGGPWSGYPAYEDVAGRLLLDFPTDELIAAASLAELSEPQTEGAARLFAGWTFATERPEDRDSVPPGLRKLLLDHVLRSRDEDKRERAEKAFATSYDSPPITHAAMELIRAAKAGDAGAVATLLAAGARTDSKDPWGKTAIYWACASGHLAVVRLLLEHGAPVEGLAGVDALTDAAGSGYAEIVRLLLDHGAAVNIAGWRGMPPLYFAAREGHREVVTVLLRGGADVNQQTNGRTPLEAAIGAGRTEVSDMLVRAGARR